MLGTLFDASPYRRHPNYEATTSALTNTDKAAKKHGDMAAANGSLADTTLGEPPISPGLLGRGKMISSCTTTGPNLTEGGMTLADGNATNDAVIDKRNTGTAP